MRTIWRWLCLVACVSLAAPLRAQSFDTVFISGPSDPVLRVAPLERDGYQGFRIEDIALP